MPTTQQARYGNVTNWWQAAKPKNTNVQAPISRETPKSNSATSQTSGKR